MKQKIKTNKNNINYLLHKLYILIIIIIICIIFLELIIFLKSIYLSKTSNDNQFKIIENSDKLIIHEATKLCKILYIQRELMSIIPIQKQNLDLFIDGFDIGTPCYYKDFMYKEYYDKFYIINKTKCCSIWNDYRIVCRWGCKLQNEI